MFTSVCVCVYKGAKRDYHLSVRTAKQRSSHLISFLPPSPPLPSTTQPPKVQQKTKEQKLAAAMAGGKSKKKVRARVEGGGQGREGGKGL